MVDEDFKNVDGVFEEPGTSVPEKSERNWAMACHLAALCGYLLPVTFAQFIAPLVIWLIKRDEGAFIDDQGKEVLNFQLSLLLYFVICVFLTVVVIGAFLIPLLLIFGFICPIIGAVKASEGKYFRYPMCIRFIS